MDNDRNRASFLKLAQLFKKTVGQCSECTASAFHDKQTLSQITFTPVLCSIGRIYPYILVSKIATPGRSTSIRLVKIYKDLDKFTFQIFRRRIIIKWYRTRLLQSHNIADPNIYRIRIDGNTGAADRHNDPPPVRI